MKSRYVCTGGHDLCYGGDSAGPECPYCERRPAGRTRRYLTGGEKANMLIRQGGRCAICAEDLTDPVEWDHSTPHAFRPERKPDQAVHRRCHRAKTARDVAGIAKAKRLHRSFVLGEKRRKRKIASRGFDKAWRRRMDGTTERREADGR